MTNNTKSTVGRNAEDWTKKYLRRRPLYVQFTTKIEMLLRDLLRARNLEFHLLESRTKDESSFQEKINRASKNYTNPLAELTDLSGVRIITYYQADSDIINELIESEFSIDRGNSYTPASGPSDFGYKSTHYVVSLTATRSRLLEWQDFADLKAELQVRTVLQHAWAAISHKLQYKREQDIPNQLKRKLFRLSALFELADDEFVSLKAATGELSETIGEQLLAGQNDIEVNFLSVESFVSQSAEVAELSASAAEAGFSFERPDAEDNDGSDSISNLVAVLELLEIRSIRKLQAFIQSALPWALDYFSAQYRADKEGDSSEWYVTPPFVCQLILFPLNPKRLRLGNLLRLGWNSDIANRVLKVAHEFAISQKA